MRCCLVKWIIASTQPQDKGEELPVRKSEWDRWAILTHPSYVSPTWNFFIVNPYLNNLFTPPPLSPVDCPWVHKLHEWVDKCCESFDPLYSAGVPVSVCTWTQTHCSTLWPIIDCTHLFIGPETSRHFCPLSFFTHFYFLHVPKIWAQISVQFFSLVPFFFFVFISSSGPTLSLASLHNCCLLDLLNSTPWSFRILSNFFFF